VCRYFEVLGAVHMANIKECFTRKIKESLTGKDYKGK
jgi:hypothetical protein